MGKFYAFKLELIELRDSQIHALMEFLGWPKTERRSAAAGRIINAVNQHSVFLVKTAEGYVATATLVLNDVMSENIAVVRDLVVLEQYRYGEAHELLMRALQDRARVLNAARLELCSKDQQDRNFYGKRLGFSFTVGEGHFVFDFTPREWLANAQYA